jgi:hypothetical protein
MGDTPYLSPRQGPPTRGDPLDPLVITFPRVAQRAASQEISGSPGCFTHTAPLLLASWAEFQDRIRPIAETLSGAVLAR